MDFYIWDNPYNRRLYKNHCCANSSGGVDFKRQMLINKMKQLVAKMKRLMAMLATAKSPTERNSLQMRIEQVQAEIAMVEREMKT